MKTTFLSALFIHSALFASITWQAPENLINNSATSGATSLAVDSSGNALCVFGYTSGGPPVNRASIHTSSSSTWGSLISGIASSLSPVSSFATANSKFVTIYSLGTAIYSQTLGLNESIGALEPIEDSIDTIPETTATAALPNGNAIVFYTHTNVKTRDSILYKTYNPQLDTWSSVGADISLTNQTINTLKTAADSGSSYGTFLCTQTLNAYYFFRIGNDSSSLKIVDEQVVTDSITVAGQVKETDTDGMFLFAYAKNDDIIYAKMKPAGSLPILVNIGAISDSGDTIVASTVKAALNKNGDGAVVWATEDNKLIAAKYTASTNTFGSPVTIATNGTGVSNLASDGNGNIHLFCTLESNSNNLLSSIT
ncbi:MAG: hypothetical protein P0S94_02950, partial [Simkaniaceae bacterium]|nr:hypothetical protein [Simkaniaceae bacterium]